MCEGKPIQDGIETAAGAGGESYREPA